jgi:hypothetical protein
MLSNTDRGKVKILNNTSMTSQLSGILNEDSMHGVSFFFSSISEFSQRCSNYVYVKYNKEKDNHTHNLVSDLLIIA